MTTTEQKVTADDLAEIARHAAATSAPQTEPIRHALEAMRRALRAMENERDSALDREEDALHDLLDAENDRDAARARLDVAREAVADIERGLYSTSEAIARAKDALS